MPYMDMLFSTGTQSFDMPYMDMLFSKGTQSFYMPYMDMLYSTGTQSFYMLYSTGTQSFDMVDILLLVFPLLPQCCSGADTVRWPRVLQRLVVSDKW